MRVIAIIPARGGSVGVKRKALRALGGKPLIQHTIEKAMSSELVDSVVVSTDDEQIAKESRGFDALDLRRPSELSTNKVMVWDVVRHVAQFYQSAHAMPDYFVELHPTYPFRKSKTIDGVIRLATETVCDGVLCASPFYDRVWRQNGSAFERLAADISIEPRQIQEALYIDHYGLANVYSAEQALRGNPYQAALTLYQINDEIEGFDIDTETDLKTARLIYENTLFDS